MKNYLLLKLSILAMLCSIPFSVVAKELSLLDIQLSEAGLYLYWSAWGIVPLVLFFVLLKKWR